MRTVLMASAAVLLICGSARAQNSTGSPLSTTATNTSSANSKSAISPRLPISADDASVDQFLSHADSALRRGRTGEAQEALERAETRLLSRSTEVTQAGTPDTDPRVASIEQARQALGHGDRTAAMQAIKTAMATPAPMPVSGGAMPPPATQPSSDATPYVGPGPAAGVVPNTLGGIANGVGSPGGTGTGTGNRPQASFSGPSPSNASPPGSLGGIATSVGSADGNGVGTQNRPQASFGGSSAASAAPPGSLGGIATSVSTADGDGVGTRSKPQASFSGPSSAQVIMPPGPPAVPTTGTP